MENQINTPKLRFPEFSNEWEKKKLKDTILTIIDNRGKTPPVCEDGEIPLLEIGSMGDFHIEYSKIEKYVDKKTYNTWFRKYLKKGDVLFSTVGARAGICSYYRETIVSVVAQNIIGIRFRKEDSIFMYYLLTERRNNSIIKSIQMTGAQPSIKVPQLTELHFSFPTFNEQIKIGSFINTVDNKLCELKKKKGLLEQYKKGVMQKLFSKELRFKDENGKDFGEWKEKKLGEISDFLDGRRKPIKEADRAKIKGNYPYYGASGIIDFVNDYLFDEEIILLGEDGENIISRNLPLAFKVSGKCWINNHAHVLKPKVNTNIDFLTQSLERISYVEYNTGTAQPKLNQAICKSIILQIPSLPEQTKIANFLSAIDNKINHCGMQIEKMEGWKKGLLQRMFV